MKYKYLAAWSAEYAKANLVFKDIERFEDQYRLLFRKQKKYLQINFASEDSFCFFSDKQILPWKKANELSNIQVHLSSARFTGARISEADRIIFLHFEKIDIYNQRQKYSLIVELIPRYQNLILIDKEQQIVDCKKKISFAENRHRQILPSLQYAAPPVTYQNADEAVIFPLQLQSKQILEAADSGFDNLNSLLEELYYHKIFSERTEQKRAAAIGKVQKQIKKKERKISKLQKELSAAEKVQEWKQKAELLKGNFAQLKPGMEEISLLDYYQPDFPEITIKLFSEFSPQKNIDWYFKKYRKARDGKKKISEQISLTWSEIDSLEREIFELEEQEFFFSAKQDQAGPKREKKSFKKISIDSDWEIFIGRTSSENDLLTTKLAKPQDWWFHTRIYRGTHIILRNYQKLALPEELKLICCRIAAYYSKAKKSTNVPVDYTEIRYVRKPRGSAPGYVTYKNQKTLFVDPLSMRAAVEVLEKWSKK
ncbi:MAG: NFACT RNA binding domain-containing protein [Candidatus Cloacimonadales bacterium]